MQIVKRFPTSDVFPGLDLRATPGPHPHEPQRDHLCQPLQELVRVGLVGKGLQLFDIKKEFMKISLLMEFGCLCRNAEFALVEGHRQRCHRHVFPWHMHSVVFTCGRRPTGHGEIPVVVVVVVVGGGGNNFPKKGRGGSHPILKS